MLFTQHINTLTASVNGIQNQIEELEAQLRTLRSHKASFEAELQQILTLEGAAESALNQTQSFINAAVSLDRTDLIETFWTAMDSLQSPNIPQLPEGTPDTDTEPSEPINPVEPDTDIEEPTEAPGVITVEPITETDTEVEPRPLASVGSAAFNPSTADFDILKRWVRSHQTDDKTRQQGSLTRRSTWEHAAKAILNA